MPSSGLNRIWYCSTSWASSALFLDLVKASYKYVSDSVTKPSFHPGLGHNEIRRSSVSAAFMSQVKETGSWSVDFPVLSLIERKSVDASPVDHPGALVRT